MKKSIKFLPLLATGLLAVGCQDYDAGFTESDIKAKQYADNFTKEFGQVDPNQDWSMAQNVSVDIRVPQMISGEVTVYTSSPLGSNCKILGNTSIADGVAHLNIDVVKGTKEVYVIAKNQDGMAINGYFEIENNALNISKGAATRAGETCPVTIGDPLNYQIYMLPKNVASVDGAVKSSGTKTQEGQTINYESWNVNSTMQNVQNLYYLNNVDYSTRTDVMHLGDLATFLRSYKNTDEEVKPGVFKEGIEHISLMGNELQKDAYYVMAEDGPITMSYVYKGTVERHNYFGYFYYPKDEEMTAEKFRTINKYILVNYITGAPDQTIHHEQSEYRDLYKYDLNGETKYDANPYYKQQGWNHEWDEDPANHSIDGLGVPVLKGDGTTESYTWWDWQVTQSNVTKDFPTQVIENVEVDTSWDETISGNGSLIQRRYRDQTWHAELGTNLKDGDWFPWADASGMDMPAWIASDWNDDDEIMGTKFKLTFFGYDGNATPTYTFPKDCKVGFFFVKYFDSETNTNNKLYTSFSSINVDYINEVPTAATFRYRNYVVLGLEDQPYGDCDQNDVLFLAEGNFDTEEIPDLTPPDDPEKEPETQKWLVACEDLGGTFDYDFNDIIIGFEKKTDGHLYMTPLTSGGTLPSVVSYEGKGAVGEIHQLLGDPEADIYAANVACRPGTAIDLGECDDEGIAAALQKLFIKVDDGNDNVTILTTGFAEGADETPQMLLLPGGWDWPTEGTRITSVYNEFVQWVKDADYTSWTKKTGAKYITNTWGK